MLKVRRQLPIKFRDGEEPQVNLTPLIDVVFVVLISFILIAPLLQIDEIDLAQGGKQSKTLGEVEKSRLQMHIHANNDIRLNNNPVHPDQLPRLLKAWRARAPLASPALVFCDQRAKFGTYQLVKCALEQAGFEQMELVLTPSNQKI